MSVLDNIIQSSQTGLAGTDYKFIDADTLVDAEGNSFRIQGIDAPEVEKVIGGEYKLGTAGGEAATDTLRGLANDMGFTNVAPILDANGEPVVDQFGRGLVDLKNEKGESFKSKILETGVLGTTRYTSAQDTLTAELGELQRERDALTGSKRASEWDVARNAIETAIAQENWADGVFKTTAVDEAQLAAVPSHLRPFYATDNVQVRDYDRTIHNQSVNPFSDSWEQGWIGVKEASYGMLNMLGETTGGEWLEDIGEAGVERARTQIQDYGSTLTDWRKVKDFDTAIQYVTNNAALSLPYMAISIGGAAAAPVTGGASLALPAAVYAGQSWNEMEGDKNAAVAIGSGVAQAALDRLGLGFIVAKAGKAGGKKLLEEGVEALVKQGVTREVAEAQVMAATRKELAGFIGDAAQVAREQIAAKQLFKNLAKGVGIGAGGEAITEAMQETIGYTAATMGSDKVFDFQELTDRALAGFIAGGALGGAFSTPGTLYDAGAWADVAVRQAPADAARLSQSGKYAEQEVAQHGRVQSIPELLDQTKARDGGNVATMDERMEWDRQNNLQKSFGDKIFETVTSAPALWRGATRWIFSPDLQAQSRSMRILADMFGGNLQKVFSGASYENEKHHRVTTYKNMIDIPERVFASFNDGKKTSRKQREEISAQIYHQMAMGIDPQTGRFNPDLVPDGPHKQTIIQLQAQMSRLADKMHADQKKHNPELGYLENYLQRYKAFDKKAIHDNKPAFVQALMDEFNFSEVDAKNIADAIVTNENVDDLSSALDATQAAGKPGSHKKRSLNLAERDRFQQFMEKDIFRNINAAAKSAARYTTYQDYVGDNKGVINRLLADAEAEGVSPDQINKVARQLNDYLLAESGNYKRPESEAGKTLQKVQRNFMMVTTLAGLPLATISSFVEAALTMRGLTMDQMFGKGDKEGGLYHLGNELGHTLWKGMSNVAALGTRKEVMPAATQGKEVIKNLGYLDWDVGAATTTGVSETNPWQQTIYQNFFTWTGLQGWTNYTRAVRAAIAGDYITDKLQIIFDSDPTAPTNEVQEAREGLRNIGINVDDMLDAYAGNGMFDPAKTDIIEQNFRDGMFNFVNDAVALPQAANRPLIYQDPRFALFTQFQGFIATFTANHIPKLWGEYVKRGTPAMKYNAFAVMTTMIMLGFASQYLKDLIKYGKSPAEMGFGPDDHPFLNTSEYLQRGIRSSGLLGTGERVLDQFFPLYEERSDGPGDWIWNQATGESPALGYAKRAGKGAGKLIEGDVGGAAKEATRFVPGVGVINWIRDEAEEAGSRWNFTGE